MESPKYVLCPGPVTSKTDGDTHWINARQLAQLYCVPMNECVVQPRFEEPDHIRRMFELAYGHLPQLHPRYDGDYPIFKESA